MNTLKSFLMDETGSASPKSGFASTWCFCALFAVMTLFGAFVQPAFADKHKCKDFECCGETRKISCPEGEECGATICVTYSDGYCEWYAVCVGGQ